MLYCMILPIEIKKEEFMVVVFIELHRDFDRLPIEDLLKPLPESFVPLYVDYNQPIIKVYCLCNSQNDFVNMMGRTGYKTKLI